MQVTAIGGVAEIGAKDSPRKVKESATDFEAMLISQMLRHARESGGGGWLGGEDQAGSAMIEVAEEQLGKVIAQAGGMGLADLVAKGLRSRSG